MERSTGASAPHHRFVCAPGAGAPETASHDAGQPKVVRGTDLSVYFLSSGAFLNAFGSTFGAGTTVMPHTFSGDAVPARACSSRSVCSD